ncbi:MAG: hypothetical protein AAGD33_19810 [Actinomycetota bacterium]
MLESKILGDVEVSTASQLGGRNVVVAHRSHTSEHATDRVRADFERMRQCAWVALMRGLRLADR